MTKNKLTTLDTIITKKFVNLANSFVSIHVIKHDSFESVPCHNHDYIEVIYGYEATTYHIINGEHITLNPGELLFINKLISHENIGSDKNNSLVNILIKDSFLDELVVESCYDPIIILANNNLFDQQKIPYMKFDLKAYPEVKINIQNALDLQKNSRFLSYLRTRIFIMSIIITLIEKIALEEKWDTMDKNLNFINKLLEYINKNISTASLNDFSKSINYSVSKTSNLIKTIFSQNFITILHEIRIKKAEEMLLNTNFPIDIVIEKIGYSNKSYFYKMFNKKFGCSPAEYRKLRNHFSNF